MSSHLVVEEVLTHGGIVPAGLDGLFPLRQKGEGQEREDPDGRQAVDQGTRHVEAKETMSHILEVMVMVRGYPLLDGFGWLIDDGFCGLSI